MRKDKEAEWRITLPASYSTVAWLISGLLDAAGAFSVAVNVRVAAGHRLFDEAVGLREAKVFHTCLPPITPCSLSPSSTEQRPLTLLDFLTSSSPTQTELNVEKKIPLSQEYARELHQMFINHNFEIWHKNAYRLSCYVNTERTKKPLIISRWGFFFSLFLMLECEECPNFINLKYVLALHFLLPLDAPHPAEKKRMKKKNIEWKWATESLASRVGVGGRVTAL